MAIAPANAVSRHFGAFLSLCGARNSIVKKIEAIIRHHKVDDVKAALVQGGFQGMTLTEVRGFGRQKGHTETYRGAEYAIDFVPKVKIELVVPADRIDLAVQLISQASRTGQIGDGKVFISDLENVVRIRTGETGDAAI